MYRSSIYFSNCFRSSWVLLTYRVPGSLDYESNKSQFRSWKINEREEPTCLTVEFVNHIIVFFGIDDLRCGKGGGRIRLARSGFTVRLEVRVSNDHVASIVLHSASQLSGFLVRPTQDHEIGITANDNCQFREVRRVTEQLTRPGSQYGNQIWRKDSCQR